MLFEIAALGLASLNLFCEGNLSELVHKRKAVDLRAKEGLRLVLELNQVENVLPGLFFLDFKQLQCLLVLIMIREVELFEEVGLFRNLVANDSSILAFDIQFVVAGEESGSVVGARNRLPHSNDYLFKIIMKDCPNCYSSHHSLRISESQTILGSDMRKLADGQLNIDARG